MNYNYCASADNENVASAACASFSPATSVKKDSVNDQYSLFMSNKLQIRESLISFEGGDQDTALGDGTVETPLIDADQKKKSKSHHVYNESFVDKEEPEEKGLSKKDKKTIAVVCGVCWFIFAIIVVCSLSSSKKHIVSTASTGYVHTYHETASEKAAAAAAAAKKAKKAA